MKNLIFTSIFLTFAVYGFSQSVKVENGKAVEVKPAVAEAKTVLTKEQLMEKKKRLNQEINMVENEISRNQKRLSDLKVKLMECENVCATLGY